MAAVTTSTALPGQTTTPLLGEQPSPTTTTQGISSLDLFPTAVTGAATATSTSNGSFSGKGTSPSLYLIIFLSILVLLLVTSIGIAIRTVYLRRRYRNNVDRMTRGEIPYDWAAPGIGTGMYDYSWWRSWGMSRYFGSNLDTVDLDGFIPGDWRHTTGGRRRKHRKDYGEVPVLHETDLSEALVDDGAESGWESKQPLAISVPHACLYRSLLARTEGRESQTAEAVNTQPNQTNDYSAPVLSYDNDRGATTPSTPTTCDHSLHIRYLIRMPESEGAIANRSQPDEYGEIVSHGPIEIGVWQPVLDMEDVFEKTDQGPTEYSNERDNHH
ncbi:hypothetical protein QFC22_005341 [Naganishia vaughanmartiniae]|uniref:Uncharacterized protein n=1 Tax=Naganishia vaughanmartiniae TaxID=1424756 RepID=A0ACC2WTB8_9TREE|nr:hypothetical protein QFC22_005341 [Naganishia vaughanmartiniae]